MTDFSIHEQAWPALPLREWQGTCQTLHLWTQVLGKVRLALSPYINHWWEVPFYVNARGLTTSAIPYRSEDFEVQFDFIDHELEILTSWGQARTLPLSPCSVATFYNGFMASLHSLGIEVKIWPMPVEIPNPIRFDQDRTHASYDPEYAHRFWRILATVDTVLKEFRGRFIGKASPVHFFWAVSILPLRAFRAVVRRRARAQMLLHGKLILTNCAARVFGREAVLFKRPLSTAT